MKNVLLTIMLAIFAAGLAPAFAQPSPSPAGMSRHKMMRSHAVKKHRVGGGSGKMPASKNF